MEYMSDATRAPRHSLLPAFRTAVRCRRHRRPVSPATPLEWYSRCDGPLRSSRRKLLFGRNPGVGGTYVAANDWIVGSIPSKIQCASMTQDRGAKP